MWERDSYQREDVEENVRGELERAEVEEISVLDESLL